MKKSTGINKLYEDYLSNPSTSLEPLLVAIHKKALGYYSGDEDGAQEFLVKILEDLPQLEIKASFAAYLHNRLCYRHLDWCRKQDVLRKREQQAPILLDDDGEPYSDEESLDILQFRAMQKQGHEPQRDFGSIADGVLRRVAGLLSYGCTLDEAAVQLNTTPGAIRKRNERYQKKFENNLE